MSSWTHPWTPSSSFSPLLHLGWNQRQALKISGQQALKISGQQISGQQRRPYAASGHGGQIADTLDNEVFSVFFLLLLFFHLAHWWPAWATRHSLPIPGCPGSFLTSLALGRHCLWEQPAVGSGIVKTYKNLSIYREIIKKDHFEGSLTMKLLENLVACH